MAERVAPAGGGNRGPRAWAARRRGSRRRGGREARMEIDALDRAVDEQHRVGAEAARWKRSAPRWGVVGWWPRRLVERGHHGRRPGSDRNRPSVRKQCWIAIVIQCNETTIVPPGNHFESAVNRVASSSPRDHDRGRRARPPRPVVEELGRQRHEPSAAEEGPVTRSRVACPHRSRMPPSPRGQPPRRGAGSLERRVSASADSRPRDGRAAQ